MRSWDKFDEEAEKEAKAIRSHKNMLGHRGRSDGAVGGKHTSRTRNHSCVVATPIAIERMGTFGIS